MTEENELIEEVVEETTEVEPTEEKEEGNTEADEMPALEASTEEQTVA